MFFRSVQICIRLFTKSIVTIYNTLHNGIYSCLYLKRCQENLFYVFYSTIHFSYQTQNYKKLKEITYWKNYRKKYCTFLLREAYPTINHHINFLYFLQSSSNTRRDFGISVISPGSFDISKKRTGRPRSLNISISVRTPSLISPKTQSSSHRFRRLLLAFRTTFRSTSS